MDQMDHHVNCEHIVLRKMQNSKLKIKNPHPLPLSQWERGVKDKTWWTQNGVRAVLFALFLFSFSPAEATPPVVFFNHFTHEVTTDNQPILTGLATDELYPIVSVECRVDGGDWTAASPINGTFDSTAESFKWIPPRALSRGPVSHEAQARARDSAGNINSTYITYGFYVIGEQPEIDFKNGVSTVINGDIISKNPSFDITTISKTPPVTLKSSIQKESQTPIIQTLSLVADPGNPYIYRGKFAPLLEDGEYTIKLEATDNAGERTDEEYTKLMVRTADRLSLLGSTLCYPNPFNPEAPPLSIAYVLSRSTEITLTIHDLIMNQVIRMIYPSGTEGGRAGYNEIIWSGRDEAGNMAGNGIYVYLIAGEGRVLGKGKITLLK